MIEFLLHSKAQEVAIAEDFGVRSALGGPGNRKRAETIDIATYSEDCDGSPPRKRHRFN
jgi:hypothetical protein